SRSPLEQLELLHPRLVRVQTLLSMAGQLVDRVEAELGALSLGFWPEDLREGLALDGHLGLVLLEPVLKAWTVADQAHGKLVALERHRVRVLLLLGRGLAERLERVLGADAGIVEPPPVGLDDSLGHLLALVRGSLDNLAVPVPDGLALLV